MNSGYLKFNAGDIGWDQFLLGIEIYYSMVHEDNILCIAVLYFHIIIEC